jgi:pilus assembly protein CpaB
VVPCAGARPQQLRCPTEQAGTPPYRRRVLAPVPLVVRVVLWRLRRVFLAATVVGIGLVIAGRAAPSPERTEPVVVTAREVRAGAVLAARDLRVTRVPAHLAPDEAATDPDRLTGEELLVSLPRGVPVVPSMLADGRFGRAAPPGTVTVPVRVDVAVAGLLRPGDRIDLVTSQDFEGGSPVVLARGALVLDVVAADSATAELWSGAHGNDPITVVAVSSDEGHRLAGSGWGSLGAVLLAGS